jgi:hypothetical protein
VLRRAAVVLTTATAAGAVLAACGGGTTTVTQPAATADLRPQLELVAALQTVAKDPRFSLTPPLNCGLHVTPEAASCMVGVTQAQYFAVIDAQGRVNTARSSIPAACAPTLSQVSVALATLRTAASRASDPLWASSSLPSEANYQKAIVLDNRYGEELLKTFLPLYTRLFDCLAPPPPTPATPTTAPIGGSSTGG